LESNAIDVIGACRRFGEVRAVDGVDLAVGRGEVFGLIGPNGAGKSTLFRMMLGLLPVTAGEVKVCGVATSGPGFREVKRRIGYLPEHVVLYDNLTGLETLALFADLKGARREECARALHRVGLAEAGARRVGGYSKGMRQRLGFAQALLGNPALLFLDEPTSGLDPSAIQTFYDLVDGCRREGCTVVITSHILAEIQDRVDRLAILAGGRIRAVGTVHELRAGLELPVQLHLRLAGDAADLCIRLKDAGVQVERPAAGELVIRCHPRRKMEMIVEIGRHGGVMQDLQVREPSLEQIFFGYAEAT
jgi:Cu-processing system ATP-binding protein